MTRCAAVRQLLAIAGLDDKDRRRCRTSTTCRRAHRRPSRPWPPYRHDRAQPGCRSLVASLVAWVGDVFIPSAQMVEIDFPDDGGAHGQAPFWLPRRRWYIAIPIPRARTGMARRWPSSTSAAASCADARQRLRRTRQVWAGSLLHQRRPRADPGDVHVGADLRADDAGDRRSSSTCSYPRST